jgi:amidohydrolase
MPLLTGSMNQCFCFAAILFSAVTLASAQAFAEQSAAVEKQLPVLIETYKHLHEHPELSRHEDGTAAYLAGRLEKLGYTVTQHVGRYEDGTQAEGVVALMKNGPGPQLLLRTELDALPVREKTGVDYASRVTAKNAEGQEVGVAHACGHDLHMTVVLGVAQQMAERKEQWHGALMIIGQPAEELVQGAKAMLADHLYERFGRPDYVLSEHDNELVAAGSIAMKGGPLLAGSAILNVTMRGIGAHGSAPQKSKDPIVMAAEFVLLAQTIVSRQVDPQQPAVLTVGTIHGGTKNNIIPDEVTMGLTIRAYSSSVLDQIVDAVRHTADGIAEANGVPADRMPVVTHTEGAKPTYNDSALTERLRAPAIVAIGGDRVEEAKSIMASEDVGLFTLGGQIPGVMYWLGASDPARLAESRRTGVPLPGLHSPLFAPDYEPAIKTGVTAMTAMALELLK